MKKRIILLLAALTALLSCSDIGFERNNPWDEGGTNYRGNDQCFVDPTAQGCPNYCPSTQVGCPGYVNPCETNYAAQGCPGYCQAYPSAPECLVDGCATNPTWPDCDNYCEFYDNVPQVCQPEENCTTNPSMYGCPGFCTANPTHPECITEFTDTRDGKVYRKVVIGTQTWMGQNLNYDVPNNPSDVCYGNENANCAQYGRLYNWSTAMNGASSSNRSPSGVQGVCPVGWHIPSDAEWTTLVDYVDYPAGTRLKSSQYWEYYGPSYTGTDDYGFAALPGGNGSSDGRFGSAGRSGGWWSATEGGANSAWSRSMSYAYELVGRNGSVKTGLFSVRCVQD